jgi:hypothetical protein
MATLIGRIGGAIAVMRVPERVNFGSVIGGPDRYSSERGLERLQQIDAKRPTGLNCEVRLIWQVNHAMDIGYFAVKKVSHEKALREADPSQSLCTSH